MSCSRLSPSGLPIPKFAICPYFFSFSPTIYCKPLATNQDFGDWEEFCSIAFHLDNVHKYVHAQA